MAIVALIEESTCDLRVADVHLLVDVLTLLLAGATLVLVVVKLY